MAAVSIPSFNPYSLVNLFGASSGRPPFQAAANDPKTVFSLQMAYLKNNDKMDFSRGAAFLCASLGLIIFPLGAAFSAPVNHLGRLFFSLASPEASLPRKVAMFAYSLLFDLPIVTPVRMVCDLALSIIVEIGFILAIIHPKAGFYVSCGVAIVNNALDWAEESLRKALFSTPIAEVDVPFSCGNFFRTWAAPDIYLGKEPSERLVQKQIY